jgi:predicted Na+-dependent transporter
LVLAVIVKAAVGVGDQFARSEAPPAAGLLLATLGLCLGIHLAAWTAGFWSSGWLRFGRPVGIAVGFSCSQKTLPVALVVYAYFAEDHPLAVFPLAFYHFGQLLVDTLIADRLSRRPAEEGRRGRESFPAFMAGMPRSRPGGAGNDSRPPGSVPPPNP